RAGNVILFLDDFEFWAATPWMLSYLAMNLDDVRHCIAATTPAEFARLQGEARTLSRNFRPVTVSPLNREQTLEALRGLRDRYEVHHRTVIQDEALEAALALAERAGAGAALLARALDLLDE